MLSGVGLVPRISRPIFIASCSKPTTLSTNSLRILSSTARAAKRCSAPKNSEVSLMMMVPPSSTNRSAMRPIAGLHDRPDVVSDPPHSTPMTREDAGQDTRRMPEASIAMRIAMRVPLATALMVPSGCRLMISTRLPVGRMRFATSSEVISSRPISSTEAMFGFEPMPASVL